MDKYHYKIVGEIGKGSFGRVYRAKKLRSDYAIKKVRCDAPENVELALQEFWTLSCLKAHNNIIKFEECYLQRGKEILPMRHGDKFSPNYMYLVEMAIKGKRGWDQAQYYLWFVMEFCNCGDMNDYLLDRDPIPYLNTIFMLQLADGISFLHRSNVVHRDLKPENVLVRSRRGRDPVLKIADFGLSKVCNRPIKDDDQDGDDSLLNVDTCWLSSACGSDFFMAPEVFAGRYTAKADVFALGIMFWAIMDRITFIDAGTKKVLLGTYVRRNKEVLPVGEALLDDPNLDVTQLLVDTGQGPMFGQRLKRSQSISSVAGNKRKLRDLIAQMVHPNPEFRPSSQELLGRLGSILQPNERPKGMDWNIKKTSDTKSEIDLVKHLQSATVPKANVLHSSLETTQNFWKKKYGKRTGTMLKRNIDVSYRASNEEYSQSRVLRKTEIETRFEKVPVESKCLNLSKAVEAEVEETMECVKKVRRKGIYSLKKQAPGKTGTHNLRSGANMIKVSYAYNNEKMLGSEHLQPISVDQLHKEEIVKTVAMGDHRQRASYLAESEKSAISPNARNSEIEFAHQRLESNECFKSLLEVDVEKRDLSIVSDIPTFDSGYKSKLSRRISRVTESLPAHTERELPDHHKSYVVGDISKEIGILKESTPAPSTSGRIEVVKKNQYTSRGLNQWRRIRLKDQIRACKPSAKSGIHQGDVGCRYSDSSAPSSVIDKFEGDDVKITEVSPKPKLEVPRTPCVVMQDKARVRHNPFHTAVKKRWKYVILDEVPSLLDAEKEKNLNGEECRETDTNSPNDPKATVKNAQLSDTSPAKHVVGGPLVYGHFAKVADHDSSRKCGSADTEGLTENSMSEAEPPRLFHDSKPEKSFRGMPSRNHTKNTKHEFGCCKPNPNGLQHQILQRLSEYWHPSKTVVDGCEVGGKLTGSGHLTDQFVSKPSPNNCDVSSCNVTSCLVGGISASLTPSTANTRKASFPVIDLTLDGDYVPSCKKQRYKETGYCRAHRNRNAAKNNFRWSSLAMEARLSKVSQRASRTDHSKRIMRHVETPGESLKRPWAESVRHCNVSSQRRVMPIGGLQNRHLPRGVMPRGVSTTAAFYGSGQQEHLQMNSPGDLQKNSMPSPLNGLCTNGLRSRQVQSGICMPACASGLLCYFHPNLRSRSNFQTDSEHYPLNLPRRPELLKLPHLLYCGSPIGPPNIGKMVSKTPPNLIQMSEMESSSSQLMHGPHVAPQELQAVMALPRRLTKHGDSTSSDASLYNIESNLHTMANYSCRLRHSRPILNN